MEGNENCLLTLTRGSEPFLRENANSQMVLMKDNLHGQEMNLYSPRGLLQPQLRTQYHEFANSGMT